MFLQQVSPPQTRVDGVSGGLKSFPQFSTQATSPAPLLQPVQVATGERVTEEPFNWLSSASSRNCKQAPARLLKHFWEWASQKGWGSTDGHKDKMCSVGCFVPKANCSSHVVPGENENCCRCQETFAAA